VVTVLLARVILHERLAVAQTIGVSGALGGVVLIAVG
jgi:drug/metabolite transporter (DMT)-like permease